LYPSGVRVISPQAYVFVEERHFMEPVHRSAVVVNNTTIINKTVINEAPATTAIEKASGRKIQAVPVRELRLKTEAAVAAKQRKPAATRDKTVQPPVLNKVQPAERKAVAALEPQAVEKVAAATQESAAPTRKDNTEQAETRTSHPVAVESKPESKPAATKKPTEQKADKQPVKQESPPLAAEKKE